MYVIVLSHCFVIFVQIPTSFLRWAREGHLPYFEASSLLPSYMKFSLSDVFMFGGRVLPNKRQLYCSASALKTYIRIPSLPEQSIELYIARYLIDLQLPGKNYCKNCRILSHSLQLPFSLSLLLLLVPLFLGLLLLIPISPSPLPIFF